MIGRRGALFVVVFWIAGTAQAQDPVRVASKNFTENIILGLVVDHATDTVLPRYSIDGGATFVERADWANPAVPGAIASNEVHITINSSAGSKRLNRRA